MFFCIYVNIYLFPHLFLHLYCFIYIFLHLHRRDAQINCKYAVKKTRTFDFLWLRYLHVTLTWLSCYNYSNKTKFIDFELIWSVQNSNYLLISGRIHVYLCASCSNKLRFHCQWQTCCCISFINNKHKLLSVTSSSVTLKYRMVSHPSCVKCVIRSDLLKLRFLFMFSQITKIPTGLFMPFPDKSVCSPYILYIQLKWYQIL